MNIFNKIKMIFSNNKENKYKILSEINHKIESLTVEKQKQLFLLNQEKFTIIKNDSKVNYSYLTDIFNEFFSTYKSIKIKSENISIGIDFINNLNEGNSDYTIIGKQYGEDLLAMINNNSVIQNDSYMVAEEYHTLNNLNDNIYSYLLFHLIANKIYSKQEVSLQNLIDYIKLNQI